MMLRALKNNSGMLTLDFIFASLVVFAFSAIIFSFAITLSVVEVVQYASFATARSYSLSHFNEESQRTLAQQKYDTFMSDGRISSLFQMGWFENGDVEIGDFNDEFEPEYDLFDGARIPFSAPVLYKRIPGVGATSSDRDGFQANIQAFLSREPTFEECQEFIEGRASQFSNVMDEYDVYNSADVAVIMDNGC